MKTVRKNLLDHGVAEEIIARAETLQPGSRRHWGAMNVTEMLRHCNLANRQVLDRELDPNPSTPKQRVIGFLCLKVLTKLPQNIKGAARIDTRGTINEADAAQFEEEKRTFIRTIREFAGQEMPVNLAHPAFGRLTTPQWGIATWMHMDHHLRQFGA